MITPAWVEERNRSLDGASPEEMLEWVSGQFGPRAGLTCSFGGPGLVLAHMVSRIAPEMPVIFLNTDFLFPETLALKDEFARRYGLNLVELHPRLTPEEQASVHGDALWERDPDLCCQIRKVEPMQRALDGLDAWITGLRREQSSTRADIKPLEYHELHGGRPILKVMPLFNWTRREVWDYIWRHELPYNPLLDRGYASIGCTHCTRPVAEGEDERAGRWSGCAKTECGLHTFTRRAPVP
ncbi:MAG: phosphoadenylyl-sulfate reductase [Bacillota bacterium]